MQIIPFTLTVKLQKKQIKKIAFLHAKKHLASATKKACGYLQTLNR